MFVYTKSRVFHFLVKVWENSFHVGLVKILCYDESTRRMCVLKATHRSVQNFLDLFGVGVYISIYTALIMMMVKSLVEGSALYSKKFYSNDLIYS